MAKKSIAKKAKKVAKKTVKKLAKKAVKGLAKKAKPVVKKAIKKTKGKKNDDLVCFLTSACVRHFGLADDCYELNTLRKYRDSYLVKTRRGKELVAEYYRVAPQILGQIALTKQEGLAFPYIYTQVQKACVSIERNKLKTAEKIYLNMVNKLKTVYFT